MKLKRPKLQWFAFCLICILAVTTVAHADSSVSFSFSGLPLTTGGYATDATVQSYMNGILGAGKSVVLTGAAGTKTWTGDDHVVGGTAGTLAGATGSTYIVNNNGSLGDTTDPNSSDIKMVFTGVTITSVSFDLEIFPDGTCPSITSCGSTASPFSATSPQNLPDFELYAGTSSSLPLLHTWYGSTPAGCPHTIASGPSACELAPQLGPLTVSFSGLSGVTTLDFMDWPATIGIKNLVINKVPEPASLLLLGMGLSGLAAIRRRR